MKKLITTSVMLAVASISQALCVNESTLSITSVDGSLITVSVDRAPFSNPTTQVFLGGLMAGNHHINIKSISGNAWYPVYRTVYSGMVFIPQSSEVMSIVHHAIFQIISSRPIIQPPTVYEQPHYYPYQECQPVDDYRFNEILQSIRSRSFESTRLTMARQFIDNNYLTSRQVAQMMSLMTFESGKLELAKYAYAKTTDKSNYFLVNDKFTFESSINSLARFISSQG